jgi:arylsulfatase A-like enzyme
MKKLPFLLALLTAAVLSMRAAAAEPRAPNIVLILADDLGYGDLGCYGQQRIKTPNLDKLAAGGMRFTQFYAGSTVCAPSRCSLMTGYHSGRSRIRANRAVPLEPEDVTIAEVLKSRGYATALCGKWGLGDEGTTGVPNRQGFDHFYGYLDQGHAHNYYPAFLLRNEKRTPLANVVPDAKKNGAGVASEKKQYSHDVIFADALDFIDANKAKPFFLYLAFTIPHANNEAKSEGMEVPDLGEYAKLDWPPAQKGHAAMISRMDADVGRLLDRLRQLKLADDTLVIFSSDNGPHSEGGNDPNFNNSNGPLRGKKRDLFDGGIRVPMIAYWPGKIKAGTTSDYIGAFWDVLPTLAELTEAVKEVPKDIDGISFAPTLLGQPDKQKQHDALYWAFYERGGAQAVRMGQWKAVEQPIGSQIQLFDVTKDTGEQHDVAAEHPDVVAKAKAAFARENRPNELWKFEPENPPGEKRAPKSKRRLSPDARGLMVPPRDRLHHGAAARLVAMLDGEPLGIPLAIGVAGVAVVQQVPQLVDQDVIEVKILDRLFGPDEPPQRSVLFPTAAVHLGFDHLAGFRRGGVRLGQVLFDRVQIDRRAPLHTIARKTELLPRDAAQLDHLQRFHELLRQLGQPGADLIGGQHMAVSFTGPLADDLVTAPLRARLVPIFGRHERQLLIARNTTNALARTRPATRMSAAHHRVAMIDASAKTVSKECLISSAHTLRPRGTFRCQKCSASG